MSKTNPLPYIIPNWQAPATVSALMSTRQGGVSEAPRDSMDLGSALTEATADILQNRATLTKWLNDEGLELHGSITLLKQEHGVVCIDLDDPQTYAQISQGYKPIADAVLTTQPNRLCAVRVADCMPVLLALPDGVAAIHAGWRGLAGGIVTRTLEQLLAKSQYGVADLTAWLGPCIGPEKFEVGEEVRAIFVLRHPENQAAFKAQENSNKWLGNLPYMAEQELKRAGVEKISIDGRCTVTEEDHFFSYRRDQQRLGDTGRMIACVWLKT